jgi:hypothetical protein
MDLHAPMYDANTTGRSIAASTLPSTHMLCTIYVATVMRLRLPRPRLWTMDFHALTCNRTASTHVRWICMHPCTMQIPLVGRLRRLRCQVRICYVPTTSATILRIVATVMRLRLPRPRLWTMDFHALTCNRNTSTHVRWICIHPCTMQIPLVNRIASTHALVGHRHIVATVMRLPRPRLWMDLHALTDHRQVSLTYYSSYLSVVHSKRRQYFTMYGKRRQYFTKRHIDCLLTEC